MSQVEAQASISWLIRSPIAHRGLHDDNRTVCENSLTAFRLAIEAGYAIECDIRLSSDDVPVVFHDDELDRMTGEAGHLGERSAQDLGRLRLKSTDDTIPTFGEMLSLVAGRVPIVAELKGREPTSDRAFARSLAAALDGYEGHVALMSFDPWLVEAAATVGGRPVGLTAEGTRPETLKRHRDLIERHCSFASYNVHHLPNSLTEWMRQEIGLPVISWTVRSTEDRQRSARHADQMTFEGFRP